MAGQEELAAAIGDRLLQQIGSGATSDTILKLSEAWAWITAPNNAHGATVSS